MHWKLKAIIQNAVSLLPSDTSYAFYYWMQKNFGGLRRFEPLKAMAAGIEIWKRIQSQGYVPAGKVFFEVGTGRVPVVPLSYWLMGAEKTITMDLNPYVKEDLVAHALSYISKNEQVILRLFNSLINIKRFNQLLSFIRSYQPSISDFFELTHIDYIAPANAANTHFSGKSIDFHTSWTVFEHIPLEILKQILEEGNRITKEDGLFIHRIDYSDHFSHSDKNISAINFLQYSDKKWKKIAGNRYMYMNRLRHDDFINLFELVGHRFVEIIPDVDKNLQDILRCRKMYLNERFSLKTDDILAIKGAIFLTGKG